MELNEQDNLAQPVRIPVYEIEDGYSDNGSIVNLILLLSMILLAGIIVCLLIWSDKHKLLLLFSQSES